MKKKYVVGGVEKYNPQNFGGMVSRSIPLQHKEAIDFERGIDTIATTEAPALVVDWERYEIVREVLPMRYMELPSNDKVPLLDAHSKASIERIKGSAKNFTIEGGNLICKTFISESEPIVKQKIQEGHIDSVSIGYMTDKDFTVEIPKGASVTIDGLSYKNDFGDGTAMVVRTWWKARELSLVPIGADEAAKFREHFNENQTLIGKLNELKKELESLKADKPKEKSLTYQEAQVRLMKYF